MNRTCRWDREPEEWTSVDIDTFLANFSRSQRIGRGSLAG